jgi:hypothetical protein
MIFHAAHDVDLTPDQSAALDSIEGSLRPSEDGARKALRTLRSDIVAGIRAGKLPANVMAADYAALAAATKERGDEQAVALNGLRSLLTGPQREELALAVRARRAAHALRPPDAPDDTASNWTQERLDRLTDALDLDQAQRHKVQAMLSQGALPGAGDIKARKDAEKARADALLNAFTQDEAFDARRLDVGGSASRSGEALIEREDAFLGRLVAVLTPTQREKLAAAREGEPAASQ